MVNTEILVAPRIEQEHTIRLSEVANGQKNTYETVLAVALGYTITDTLTATLPPGSGFSDGYSPIS